MPKLLPHEKERALKNGIAQAAAWGLTSVHQAGTAEEGLEILSRALEAVPRLRVYVALDIERDPTPGVARPSGRPAPAVLARTACAWAR